MAGADANPIGAADWHGLGWAARFLSTFRPNPVNLMWQPVFSATWDFLRGARRDADPSGQQNGVTHSQFVSNKTHDTPSGNRNRRKMECARAPGNHLHFSNCVLNQFGTFQELDARSWQWIHRHLALEENGMDGGERPFWVEKNR